jgi:predicted nucleic-acid-binding Zn-ribbon protein
MKSAARLCPKCGAKLVLRDHFPVLAEVLKPPVERRAAERLKYVVAWVCVGVDCDYAEILDKSA